MVDIDYEPWLGPNWRKELQAYDKKIPTVVTNHSSFLDIWLLSCSRWEPSYLAKESTRKTIACRQCDALQSIYVTRKGDKEHKNEIIDQIVQRQHDIQKGGYAQLAIFAESFTTNNSRLARFKKGAFVSLLPVQPVVFKYGGFPGKPTMDCLTIMDNVFFALFGSFVQWQVRYTLPPFIPNDYFFEKYADKGAEKSHIYAWGVREVMSKASGLPVDDEIDFDKKDQY